MKPEPEPRPATNPGLPAGTSVSATFMSFMQPVIDDLGDKRSAWSNVAITACAVWNSMVLDAAHGSTFIADMRKLVAATDAGLIVDFLIQRKQEEFAAHQWLVGHWEFYDDVRGIPRLRVEARAVSDARTR